MTKRMHFEQARLFDAFVHRPPKT